LQISIVAIQDMDDQFERFLGNDDIEDTTQWIDA
jgi:hypothetical protein